MLKRLARRRTKKREETTQEQVLEKAERMSAMVRHRQMLYEESRRASIEAKSSQGGGAYGSMHFNSVVGEKTELGPPDDPNMF